jgi:hypothetical protein
MMFILTGVNLIWIEFPETKGEDLKYQINELETKSKNKKIRVL